MFAALADPTRRWILQALLREGSTSVPELTAGLSISRQERESAPGREVRYRLRPGALAPASSWLQEAEAAWDARLGSLKRAVEQTRPKG